MDPAWRPRLLLLQEIEFRTAGLERSGLSGLAHSALPLAGHYRAARLLGHVSPSLQPRIAHIVCPLTLDLQL
jgi:hypothetical protein